MFVTSPWQLIMLRGTVKKKLEIKPRMLLLNCLRHCEQQIRFREQSTILKSNRFIPPWFASDCFLFDAEHFKCKVSGFYCSGFCFTQSLAFHKPLITQWRCIIMTSPMFSKGTNGRLSIWQKLSEKIVHSSRKWVASYFYFKKSILLVQKHSWDEDL